MRVRPERYHSVDEPATRLSDLDHGQIDAARPQAWLFRSRRNVAQRAERRFGAPFAAFGGPDTKRECGRWPGVVKGPDMADLKRILVPTDFTDTSDRALDWAIGLASRLGGAVTLMHSYEIPVIGFPDGAIIATPEIATRISEASRQALDTAVKKRQGGAVPVNGLLREGVAWEAINAVADEMDADFIVIGTHGRRGLTRALLGSVAENVVRTAHRPVVTIRGEH
jgi:nucleotide-binding universal stress UspA family protein